MPACGRASASKAPGCDSYKLFDRSAAAAQEKPSVTVGLSATPLQQGEKPGHVGRRRAGKGHLPPLHGVAEGQGFRMQRLAGKASRALRAGSGTAFAAAGTAAKIQRIAHQRVADMGHVDADLMRPPVASRQRSKAAPVPKAARVS